jgi:cyclic dehypoxanthinyl futalosine synthase
MVMTSKSNRISVQNACDLYAKASLHELGTAALSALGKCHDPGVRTYIIDRNINYTNICTCRCKFCAFNKPSAKAGGSVLPYTEIYNKIFELRAVGGNQILMQGGLNPDLSLDWHCKLLSDIKRDFPNLHIHAYSPPEILFLAEQTAKSVEYIIETLCGAGLNSIPGGGAEILADEVRKKVSPAKCSSRKWLDVMRTAHKIGVFTTATMMFGHLETPLQRIEHLDKLRHLQDESLADGKGHFTSFTAWPFQPGSSPLSHSPDLNLAGPVEYLRFTAICRLFLDNIVNLQSSWVTLGPNIAQLSMFYGCNDMGSIMMEEKVVAAAGTSYSLNEQQLRDIITSAGFTPKRRDYYYRLQSDL